MAATSTPPLPEPVITADTLASLRLLRTIGVGGVRDAAVAPAARLLAVATTAGLALFELPELRLLRFEPRPVTHVALSPDGRLLVADTELLRVADGERLGSLPGGVPWPSAQAPRFSPNGQLIATLSGDKSPFAIADLATLRTSIWRSADQAPLLTTPGYGAAFSPDGQLMAVTTGTSVQLLRLPDGEVVRTIDLALEGDDYVKDLAFSANGQLLYAAMVSALQVRRVADGGLERAQPFDDSGRSYVAIDNVVLSPAGDLVATSIQGPEGPSSGFVLRHTLDGGSIAGQVAGGNRIRFSPDGATAVLWSNSPLGPADTLTLLDTRRGTASELSLPSFLGLSFSPDAQTLATFSSSRAYLWGVVDGSLQQALDTGLGAFTGGSLRWSLDGRRLALGGDQAVLYGDGVGQAVGWDLGGGRAFSWETYMARIWALHGDGMLLASIGGPADGPAAALVHPTSALTQPLSLPPTLSAAAFSPDGSLLAVGDTGGSVQLRRVSDLSPSGTLQAGAGVTELTFSPDGTLLGARQEDGLIQVWRLGELDPIARFAGGRAGKLVFTSDNQLAISSGATGLAFHRLSDGRLLRRLDVAAEDFAIGPRRRLLAVLSAGQVQLWGVGP